MNKFIKILLFVIFIGITNNIEAKTYIKGLYYNLDKFNNTAKVTCYSNNLQSNTNVYTGVINIPESVNYNGQEYKVTSISSNAFQGCNLLESITIPSTVTYIADGAFRYTGLTSVIIPDNVRRIEYDTFYGCTKLASVTFPESLTSIGSRAFYGCNLTSISLPNNDISIGSEAFSGCDFVSIEIPKNIIKIYEKAFECKTLESVTFLGTISLEGNIFGSHSPSKVIWLSATPPVNYEKTSGLINYVPNDQYSKLSNVVIYPSLSSLFESDGIKYVPISVSERICDAIDISYNKQIETINIKSSVLYNGIEMKVKNISPYLCRGYSFLKKLKWQYNGTIPSFAFSNCIGLQNVDLGNMATAIGKNCFEGCSALKQIEGDENVENVDSYAFSKCTSLTDVSIGPHVSRIEEGTYSGCDQLSSIIIPPSVVIIKKDAFKGCKNLNKFVVVNPEGKGNLHVKEFPDWLGTCQNDKVTYSFNVQANDRLIFNYSAKCTDDYWWSSHFVIKLNGEIIIDAVKETGYYMKTFNAAQVVTLEAFLYDSVGTLDDKVEITNMEVGNDCSLMFFDNALPLFSDCKLENVYLGRSINISDKNGFSPFYNNTSLQFVEINHGKRILDKEFWGCTNLQNVSISNSVTKIGEMAFSGCNSLQYIVFSPNMQSIGKEAFSGCVSINKVISLAVIPPVCDTNAFDGINKWNCTLSVPEGCNSVYQQADQWKDFFFIDNDVASIDAVVNAKGISVKERYTLDGKRQSQPQRGLNILRMSDGTTRKVVIK